MTGLPWLAIPAHHHHRERRFGVSTTTLPGLPATLADEKAVARKLLRDRADAEAADRRRYAAWRAAVDAAQRVLPAALFGLIPGAHEMPADFDGRACVLRFVFAGHFPVAVLFTATEDGSRWNWDTWHGMPTRDPLDIRKGGIYLAERPDGAVAYPDLPSALIAAEQAGVAITDDDGE